MPHSDFALTSMVFVSDRPRCPWCGKSMWLARVVSVGPHLSERTFECATCEAAKEVLVERDQRSKLAQSPVGASGRGSAAAVIRALRA